MSVNMSVEDGDTDYSDFEYQFLTTELILRESDDTAGSGNASALGRSEITPLDQVGGLDNNEVAELVAIETTAAIEVEDEVADQDVATAAEVRGAVGVNLPATANGLPQVNSELQPNNVGFTSNITENNVEVQVNSKVEDRYFQIFEARGTLPFDDQANGPGGGGSQETFHNTKNFRNLTGRGPVLDNDDDLNVILTVNVGDTVVDVSGVVRSHLVWDIAETSDAGRRFSVPM